MVLKARYMQVPSFHGILYYFTKSFGPFAYIITVSEYRTMNCNLRSNFNIFFFWKNESETFP